MENGSIEMVNTFPYLGSNIVNDGEITSEVASQMVKASEHLDVWKPIFKNPKLTKRAAIDEATHPFGVS